MKNMKDDWCILSLFDARVDGAPEAIKPGFYAVHDSRTLQPDADGAFYSQKFLPGEKVSMPVNGIWIPNGKRSHVLIKFLLSNNFIELSDISRYVYSSYNLPAATFKDYVKDIYKTFPKHGKMLFNPFQEARTTKHQEEQSPMHR